MAFTKKCPNFFFFHYFLVPLADKIPAEPLPENLKLVGFMFAQGG